MGCIESTINNALEEIAFEKEIPRKVNIIVINSLQQHDEPDIVIDEKLLCDDNLETPITFTTTKNDIQPISEPNLKRHSKIISQAAVKKLLERKYEEKDKNKIKVDDEKLKKIIQKNIKRNN